MLRSFPPIPTFEREQELETARSHTEGSALHGGDLQGQQCQGPDRDPFAKTVSCPPQSNPHEWSVGTTFTPEAMDLIHQVSPMSFQIVLFVSVEISLT